MKIVFATTNRGKYSEAKKILEKQGLEIERMDFKYNEIRSESLKEIARDAVLEAYSECEKPVFVEDAGLFIESLNGFPGTYSGWVLKKLGKQGILDLMKERKNRKAEFRSVIAYHDGKKPGFFSGVCKGEISVREKGKLGFGYDPLFVPEGKPLSFAESIELKNKLSHRYKSLKKFSKFLSK